MTRNSQEFDKMTARDFNMLRVPTPSQKAYVESQGYYVNATGKVHESQESHIVGLLKTYDGKMVAVLGKDQWASTIKPRDRRTQYVPGSSETDQVEVDGVGQSFSIRRTRTTQDKMVPYMTERHRMKGVEPVARTVSKTIVMAIPGSLVTRLRQSARAKKGDDRLAHIRQRAAILLDDHPACALNVQTWTALLEKAGVTGTSSQFSELMKALNARTVGRAMALKCWTLKTATRCQDGTRRRPRKMEPALVFAGGMKPSKNLLRMARGEKVRGKMPADVPNITIEPTRDIRFPVIGVLRIRLVTDRDGTYCGISFTDNYQAARQFSDGSWDILA